MIKVKLENITKKYNNNIFAVQNFNLNIAENEFIVLVGPSGCGKSTTLRMIAGLETISEGNLYINNNRVNDISPRHRDLAMVFQNYALYPHMNVYDNLKFGLENKKTDKKSIKEKISKVAETIGLSELLKRKPSELSGGQRQRVALGRALIKDTDIFLMDEPLSNLDAQLRVHMRKEIIDLHRNIGATTIYVTHDQTEAMTMADRIVIMQNGVIQQIGTPRDIYNKPENLFVATFIGSPNINTLDATINKGSITIEGHEILINRDMTRHFQTSNLNNKEVILAIRPEDVLLSEENYSFNTTINHQELVNNELLIYTKIGNTQIVFKQPDNLNLVPGKPIKIKFDFTKIHIFDKETHENIGLIGNEAV